MGAGVLLRKWCLNRNLKDEKEPASSGTFSWWKRQQRPRGGKESWYCRSRKKALGLGLIKVGEWSVILRVLLAMVRISVWIHVSWRPTEDFPSSQWPNKISVYKVPYKPSMKFKTNEYFPSTCLSHAEIGALRSEKKTKPCPQDLVFWLDRAFWCFL